MHSIMKLNGQLYNKKCKITNSHSFMKCPIILLLISSHLLLLSLSVLSHVITYGTLMIFRHWKQELVCIITPSCQLQLEGEIACLRRNSINSFKHPLKKNKTFPEHYYTGRRKAHILHTRLQTNFSALTIDLFTRN